MLQAQHVPQKNAVVIIPTKSGFVVSKVRFDLLPSINPNAPDDADVASELVEACNLAMIMLADVVALDTPKAGEATPPPAEI